MEVWLRLDDEELPLFKEGIDRMWVDSPSEDHLYQRESTMMIGDHLFGAHLQISRGEDQSKGIALMGSVDWLVVEFEDWSMIPLENLIAARSGSHTKIAAHISEPLQAQGAGFALQEGVDAIIVSNSIEMIEAALSVKAQRLEASVQEDVEPLNLERLEMADFEITGITEAGLGDRYCLDFLSLLGQGEGVLVGSSSAMLFLIHSETVTSTFVPTRPFRVNAGSPHSYILMASGATKYMADLVAGDEVLGVSVEGPTRSIVLGRIKIEQRPMLKISAKSVMHEGRKDNEAHVFMQQAETVRLISDAQKPCSVTSLKMGQQLKGWIGHGARHLGAQVRGSIEER